MTFEETGWRSCYTAGLHRLNPFLVMNPLVQYEGIVKERTNMNLQGNLLKRNSMYFAAALLVALASFIAGPNAALAASPQHHDQAPGFFRLKARDLDKSGLFDGAACGEGTGV